MKQATELHTPTEWQTIAGVRIMDADGWRHRDAPSWGTPISWEDFMNRMKQSTVMFSPSSTWAGQGNEIERLETESHQALQRAKFAEAKPIRVLALLDRADEYGDDIDPVVIRRIIERAGPQ